MKEEKSERTTLSIRMSKQEKEEIMNAAKRHNEEMSGYCRRILIESARNPFYTGKDVMEQLCHIGYDMSRLNKENINEVFEEINKRGAWICQTLSSR